MNYNLILYLGSLRSLSIRLGLHKVKTIVPCFCYTTLTATHSSCSSWWLVFSGILSLCQTFHIFLLFSFSFILKLIPRPNVWNFTTCNYKPVKYYFGENISEKLDVDFFTRIDNVFLPHFLDLWAIIGSFFIIL